MSVERYGYHFVPVRKISRIEGGGMVVNLEVDGDHTFLANGVVVHNCQHQSQSTGRPVISVNFGGVAEFFDEHCGYPIEYKFEPATMAYAGCGHWAEPIEDSLIAQMRRVYDDRSEALRRGVLASEKVKHLTWDNSNRRLVAVLNEFGAL